LSARAPEPDPLWAGDEGAPRGGFRCIAPSRYAGWITAAGEFVPARCGASNRCPYCAYLAVVENAIVVALDAEHGGHPRVGMTLTTVDPQHDLGAFRRDVEAIFRLIRARLGADVGYLGMMEWTTGQGARSGGHRRAHQHVLLKRCDPADAEAIEPEVRERWAQRTGAQRVEIRALRSVAGATAYLLYHHAKWSQAPPQGFRGKRLRPSRNYYERSVAELRREAHALVVNKRLRRAARRALDWQGLDGAPEEVVDAELTAALAEARQEHQMVTFVKLDHTGRIVSAPGVQDHPAVRPAQPGTAVAYRYVDTRADVLQVDLLGEVHIAGRRSRSIGGRRLADSRPASALLGGDVGDAA
jgi:hypothetical protein